MREVQKQHEARLNELRNREKAVIEGLERKKGDLEEKAHMLSSKEQALISKYEKQVLDLESSYMLRHRELESKEKEFWKRELEVAAKKREY
jgi:hypothetical protein